MRFYHPIPQWNLSMLKTMHVNSVSSVDVTCLQFVTIKATAVPALIFFTFFYIVAV